MFAEHYFAWLVGCALLHGMMCCLVWACVLRFLKRAWFEFGMFFASCVWCCHMMERCVFKSGLGLMIAFCFECVI